MLSCISYYHLHLQDAGCVRAGLFQEVFSEIVKGHREYEHLLLLTID
jgi:hypothetical protein